MGNTRLSYGTYVEFVQDGTILKGYVIGLSRIRDYMVHVTGTSNTYPVSAQDIVYHCT